MRATPAVTVVSALLLASCASAATPPTTSATTAGSGTAGTSGASDLSGRDIGLQLRPVLDAKPASGSACGVASGSATTVADPTQSPVTACSTDGSIVYTLGPAAVTGTQWQSLKLDLSQGSAQIDAVLDPAGSTALTKTTADLATNAEPQNQLAAYARGVVIFAPTVTQPIYGGEVLINGAYTTQEAQQLLDELTG